MSSGKSQDQNVLQEILNELNLPASLSEMPRRIELCEKALTIVPRESKPKLWGALHNDLAMSLTQMLIGYEPKTLSRQSTTLSRH